MTDIRSTSLSTWTLIKETFREFSQDRATRLAAAIAYYAIFSLAPLLVIGVALAGLVYGQQAVKGQLSQKIASVVGQRGAGAIEAMLAGAYRPHANMIMTIVGIVLLFIGASGVFVQMQDALDTVWEVTPRTDRSIWHVLRSRLVSFLMILVIGGLMLLSLVAGSFLSAAGQFMGAQTPAGHYIWMIVNYAVTLAVMTLAFAALYKVLPDVKLSWRDVLIGAVATAVLFLLGEIGIAQYLGRAGIGSAYGAAGSLLVVLVWIYYSALIILLGNEFTKVYVRKYRQGVVPNDEAVLLTERDRIHQGIPKREQVERAQSQSANRNNGR